MQETIAKLVTRGGESWAFFAFVFSALLTLAYGVLDEFGGHGLWKLILKLGIFAALLYLIVGNAWSQDLLVGLLHRLSTRTY